MMLESLRPTVADRPYVFVTVPADEAARLLPRAWAFVREAEGVTVICEQAEADRLGLHSNGPWALISLGVQTDLEAVGLLAAVTARLAVAGVSVNPVAGYYHDHLLVPWGLRDRALALLDEPFALAAPAIRPPGDGAALAGSGRQDPA
jgi:hypothetical protein